MKKLVFVIILAISLIMEFQPVLAKSEWVRLGSVRIGKVPVEIYWNVTDIMMTCKSDKILMDTQFSRVYYWINGGFISEELSPNTLVSKDTVCVFTNTAKGGSFSRKYYFMKYRFLQTWSSAQDIHRDLMYAQQEVTFNLENPELWCKSKTLAGYILPRYEYVIFKPFEYEPTLFASRDLTCSSNLKVVSRWLKTNGWSILDL